MSTRRAIGHLLSPTDGPHVGWFRAGFDLAEHNTELPPRQAIRANGTRAVGTAHPTAAARPAVPPLIASGRTSAASVTVKMYFVSRCSYLGRTPRDSWPAAR